MTLGNGGESVPCTQHSPNSAGNTYSVDFRDSLADNWGVLLYTPPGWNGGNHVRQARRRQSAHLSHGLSRLFATIQEASHRGDSVLLRAMTSGMFVFRERDMYIPLLEE